MINQNIHARPAGWGRTCEPHGRRDSGPREFTTTRHDGRFLIEAGELVDLSDREISADLMRLANRHATQRIHDRIVRAICG